MVPSLVSLSLLGQPDCHHDSVELLCKLSMGCMLTAHDALRVAPRDAQVPSLDTYGYLWIPRVHVFNCACGVVDAFTGSTAVQTGIVSFMLQDMGQPLSFLSMTRSWFAQTAAVASTKLWPVCCS